MRLIFLCVSMCFLSGCVTEQLTYNTSDVAKSVEPIYIDQVLWNFSALIDNPNAFPSQLDLGTGTVQTAMSAGPTGTGSAVPFSAATAGLTAVVTASDTSQQNWNVSAVTVSNTLRNLRAIYRYALCIDGDDCSARLFRDYHVPRILVGGNPDVMDPWALLYPQCILCKGKERDSQTGFITPQIEKITLKTTTDETKTDPVDTKCAPGHSRDPAAKTVCSTTDEKSVGTKFIITWRDAKLYVNNNLDSGRLYWINDGSCRRYPLEGAPPCQRPPEPDCDCKDLGRFGHNTLFMSRLHFDQGALENFALFVMPNPSPNENIAAGTVPAAANTVTSDQRGVGQPGAPFVVPQIQ